MLKASLTVLSFALAFAQRPGETTADTKIDLHVDPAGFLSDVAQVWSSSGGLGQLQAGQYSGYLWPMGPFFWLGDAIGLDPWVIHRLWLGTLLTLAAWGVVKLLETLLDEPRTVALAVAGAAFVVNPYVTTFTQVTSVTLLGYAALPWLMLAVHRGVRRPRGWWWPALFALVFASTGGGVNAAVTAWLVVGPLLLLLFEGRNDRRAAWGFAWRTAVVSVAASAWWVIPVGVHAALGVNFLPFTESAGAIWTTTSIPESLRLMGYWLSYIGGGFGSEPLPYFDASRQLLFSPPVVVASLLVPGLAVAGLVWTHRARYAPFFLLLLLAGLVVMTVGFPEGTLFRRGLTHAYNDLEPVQFLRTTYKAGPLVALAISALAGMAAGELWQRVRARGSRLALGVCAAGLVAVASWPLATGRALDPKFTFDEVPEEWRGAAGEVDDRLGPDARALILPGQLYAFYDWGATVDPILPALTERPVASRTAVPYSDLHAVDALWTVDSGIQQERFVPGQLPPLLRWLGVGQVVTGTDDEIVRSGATAPAEAARALQLGGLSQPSASFGAGRRFGADPGSLTPAQVLPRVRSYDVSGGSLVRLEAREGGVLLDGSAEGVAALAAFGGLDSSRPLQYAGDKDDGELQATAATVDEVVITDSNRRRVVSPARPRQTWGRTLLADDDIPADAPQLEPFAEDDPDGQTVAVLRGAAALRSPFASGFPHFPEHRPFAAFDGDTATWWEPDRELDRSQRWIEIEFVEPRDVPWVEIVPRRQQATTVTSVEVAGSRFPVEEGRNRIDVGLSGIRSLRVRVSGRDLPEGRRGGPGALAEIRVPAVRVEEALRPPHRLEDALERADLAGTTLTYLFARTTGDRPFRRHPLHDPAASAVPDDQSIEPALIREAEDPERDIVRAIEPPVSREYGLDAWVSVAPDAPDPVLDRLAGYRAAAEFRSSDRYEGRAGARASSAFDADPATAWVGRSIPGRQPWIEWETPSRTSLTRLVLTAPAAPASLPRSVRLRVDGEAGPVVPVRDGEIALAGAVRGRTFRLEVEEAEGEAVGIGEVRGPGVPTVAIPRHGRVHGSCGDLSITAGERRVGFRAVGTVDQLDGAFPLRARGCGRLAMEAGAQSVSVRGGALLPYLVELRSPAVQARVPRAVGDVIDPGEADGSTRDGVRLDLAAPARLVLGESFNEGWRASCDGEDLGEPEIAAGYANGWDVAADCREVEFSFAPQRAVELGYLLSGVACLALLGFLVVRRRDRRALTERLVPEPRADPVGPLPPGRALAAALALAAVIAFVFALRAGAVAFPLLALVFWRGVSVRSLLAWAGALLVVVVPLVYLFFPPEDRGGHNSSYATELLGAHWVAVAACVLLALAAWRLLTGGGRGAIR